MGSSKSPHSMSKISKVGVGSVILAFCILFASVQNVRTKSLPELLPEDTSPSSPSSSGVPSPSSSESFSPGSDSLVELTKTRPSHILTLSSATPQQSRFILGDDAKAEGFRIAVHLKSCSFLVTEKIHIQSGSNSKEWHCSNKDNSNEDETFGENQERHHQNGLVNVFPHEVLDGLEEILISHTFTAMNHQSHDSVHGAPRATTKATIAINIYMDLSSSGDCPSKYFNCYRELCPSRCCSDYSSSGSGGGGNQNRQMSYTLSQIPEIFTRKAGKPTRCIPEQLLCDGNPSCGLSENIDERNEVCHPKEYCMDCQTLCLTWNYVLTSLAIAVLFIITPTAIVFALFHRRNVALERARIIRMAQMRMTDMRGEFTRDDPINDLPPSYEEVHDIKVPPPCFCRAVSMDQDGPDGNGNEQGDGETSEICSCRNKPTEEDKPPEASSVSSSESNNNTEVGIDAVKAISNNSNSNCDTENR